MGVYRCGVAKSEYAGQRLRVFRPWDVETGCLKQLIGQVGPTELVRKPFPTTEAGFRSAVCKAIWGRGSNVFASGVVGREKKAGEAGVWLQVEEVGVVSEERAPDHDNSLRSNPFFPARPGKSATNPAGVDRTNPPATAGRRSWTVRTAIGNNNRPQADPLIAHAAWSMNINRHVQWTQGLGLQRTATSNVAFERNDRTGLTEDGFRDSFQVRCVVPCISARSFSIQTYRTVTLQIFDGLTFNAAAHPAIGVS